ncbi:beta-L-arabinofuranosidase domain-containing protein [Paenibacillus sp. MMS20-IR301]|uniref:beta-L-arabinofuranosidase domain-containing protein n=1 Tax=Paenibacillus sp. MMS20-IR301 TaxID=2895946 RepID=UPI0028E6C330|nr:beta-L-arabinofuranosidase domain-containing protein [Paenibacillus sp. MMS20-IR301]WNS46748.1 glycoside hydrolase family 127 protein [Paenibacillus sp. MMS20-IR301]
MTITPRPQHTAHTQANLLYQEFRMDQVAMSDPYIMNGFAKEINYLTSFDPDRLLAGFRENRGLPKKAEKYPGWENTEIRGHTLGHYLSALAQAYTGTRADELALRLKYLLGELALCQHDSGYLSAFDEQLFDNIENKQPAWVPWYTMHKIIAGLVAVYTATGNETAFTVVNKLGDWVYSRTSSWSAETQATVLAVEYGGMNDCLYELYKISGNENHLSAAHSFDELTLFTPVHDGRDILKGKHANTTIPKFLGALNRYRTLGDSEVFYLEAARQFWDMVVRHHSYITGGNSEWEHFGDPDMLDRERSNFTAETCNTYNMLKLTRELFKITGDAKYADFYENTFLNAILSSQHPHTGMTMYFQPMATGYFKVYSSPFEHFWCCTGTGMESFTKLNDSIYFYDAASIVVNQYFSSTLHSADHGVKLSLSANLTYSDTVTITVSALQPQSAPLALKLRLPDWLAAEPAILLNGESVHAAVHGQYAVISRVWADGDTLQLQLPMKLAYYNLPDARHVVAFKYGPVVLSAALGRSDLAESATGVAVSVPTRNMLVKDFITIAEGDPEAWLEQLADRSVRLEQDELAFALRGTDEDRRLVFTPHYKQHSERYGIYWRLVEADSAELQQHILQGKQQQRVQDATLDSLPVGNDQYELEHGIEGENTSVATWDGYNIRKAENGGWFSYRLKVAPQTDNFLSVTYFSGSNGKEIAIYVDGELLASEILHTDQPRSFYNRSYLIPAASIGSKTEAEVKFVIPGQENGIFDLLRMMTGYDQDAGLQELSFSEGTLSAPFKSSATAYSLTVPQASGSVQLNVAPAHKNALVYVNGTLIEDSLPREIKLPETGGTELTLTVKAEDHVTEQEYTVTLIKE